MRLLTAFFVAAILLASTAWAQTATSVSTATSGSFIVNTNVMNGGISPDGKPLARAKGKPATGDVISEITWMRTSAGKINYSIKTETIQLVDGATAWTDRTIFNTLASAAVVQGTNMGLTECTNDCSVVVATVAANSCVKRTSTGFTVVNPALFSYRDFTVCCDPNGAWVTLVSANDPGCTTPTEIK